MNQTAKIESTEEAWEDGTLGATEAHIVRAPTAMQRQVDEALGLQAISIRLPKATIEAYKNLAAVHGVGYQPLMREAIVRWADAELKQMLAGAVESQRQRPAVAPKVDPKAKKRA